MARHDPALHPPPLPPWELREVEEVAFVSLWASRPDPSLDGLIRIEALRRASGGGWERLERWSNPFPGGAEPAVSARMAREFGIGGSDLAGAVPGAEAWRDLAEFLGRRALVVADAES